MDLSDSDWEDLIDEIKQGRCTPFLGAGACTPLLPTGNELTHKLVERRPEIPPRYRSSLTAAAQYVAIERYPARPKQDVADLITQCLGALSDDTIRAHDPHAILAEMPISVYLTTNYDDLIERSLRIRQRPYHSDFCRWNRYVDPASDLLGSDSDYVPSKENPLIYHLHGISQNPDSIVISESDYVDFLVNIFRDQKLPTCVQSAIASRALVFVGYSLSDISFRIIAKGILGALTKSGMRLSVTVQLSDDDPEEREFLERYVKMIGTDTWRVYWGDAESFSKDLRHWWEKLK